LGLKACDVSVQRTDAHADLLRQRLTAHGAAMPAQGLKKSQKTF